jgi:hypothetical protein
VPKPYWGAVSSAQKGPGGESNARALQRDPALYKPTESEAAALERPSTTCVRYVRGLKRPASCRSDHGCPSRTRTQAEQEPFRSPRRPRRVVWIGVALAALLGGAAGFVTTFLIGVSDSVSAECDGPCVDQWDRLTLWAIGVDALCALAFGLLTWLVLERRFANSSDE